MRLTKLAVRQRRGRFGGSGGLDADRPMGRTRRSAGRLAGHKSP